MGPTSPLLLFNGSLLLAISSCAGGPRSASSSRNAAEAEPAVAGVECADQETGRATDIGQEAPRGGRVGADVGRAVKDHSYE